MVTSSRKFATRRRRIHPDESAAFFGGQSRTHSLLAISPDILICAAMIKSKNGQRILRLAVDTGASFTIIPPNMLLQIGLDAAQSGEKETMITANGLVYAPVVEIPLFGALGIELHGFKVLCHDLPTQSSVAGVLGLDFLSYFPPFHKFREEVLEIAPQFWKS